MRMATDHMKTHSRVSNREKPRTRTSQQPCGDFANCLPARNPSVSEVFSARN